LQVILHSLRFHWRIHAALALGVAAATAVLTGALIIGDSVRGSLRHLVLDRLGRIDQLMVVDRFFRQEMATELAEKADFKKLGAQSVPAILFPAATVQSEASSGKRLASSVLVLGIEPSFWDLEVAGSRPRESPGDGQIVINQPLAEELDVKVGDTLVVR